MKLKLRTKISYGIGGLADNALFMLIETFLLFYLTTVAGIRPATAGTILAVGCLWEAFCGPISGFLSDSIETKYGKRKPFLMAAAIPTVIVTTLLFTSIEMDYTAKVIYYGVLTLLFWWCFAIFFVPYVTWGSDLTEDYNERTVLRSYAYVFNQIGKFLGTVMPTVLVAALTGIGLSVATSWSAVGLIVGVFSGAALLICALTIKETDNPNFVKDPNAPKILTLSNIKEMFAGYFSIIKLKPIRYIIGASLLYLIVNTIFMSDMIYFYTYNMGMSAMAISGITFFMTALGIAFTPFVAKMAERTDKKMAFIFGLVITGIVQCVGTWFPIDAPWSIWVMGFFFTIGNTCYWQLMPAMIYDVCEVDELASGKKRSGEVVSLQALSESIAAAAGVQILGIILQLAGFNDEAAVQSDLALAWINNSYSWIPGLLTLVVAVILWRYPIDRKNYERIIQGVEKRRKGEAIDLNEYKDIF